MMMIAVVVIVIIENYSNSNNNDDDGDDDDDNNIYIHHFLSVAKFCDSGIKFTTWQCTLCSECQIESLHLYTGLVWNYN